MRWGRREEERGAEKVEDERGWRRRKEEKR